MEIEQMELFAQIKELDMQEYPPSIPCSFQTNMRIC